MLVSTIIANAMSKADLQNQSFYTQNDQIMDVQLAWNQMYELFMENDDDFFVTSLYLTPSVAFSLDTNRVSLYIYPIPSDFSRLRMLSYQSLTGGYFIPCKKMDTLNFGYTSQTPAYRLVGTNLEIYDPYGMSLYNLWYYPKPAVLTTATDLSYPANAIFEYMIWNIAADIRRKQNQDPTLQQTRANEIMQTMKRQINRDDFRVQTPRDELSDGTDYWR